MLSLLALSLSARVLVGVGDVDGTATVVGVAHNEHLSPICTLEHRRGFVPEGAVVDDSHAVFAVATNNERGAAIVVVDLLTCGTKELTDEAIPLQAPLVVGKTIVVVKQVDPQREGAHFEIVSVDVGGGPVTLLTARDALWITPVRGARTLSELRFLVAEGANSKSGRDDGDFHVDALKDGDLVVDVELGKGEFHSPVLVSNALLIEKVDGTRSVLIDKEASVVGGGIAGLAPVVDGARVAWGNGRKDGGVVVDGKARTGARVGVARPLLLKNDVVVVWLDRGASLPGELWSLPPETKEKTKKAQRLLPPQPKTAVKVYGVIP